MIFATLGTHHQPFERFIRAALTLAGDAELVIQHGHTARLPSGPRVRWHQWLAPDEMDALMREAMVVVTHAGVASLVGAVRAGHRPIVVPRRRHLGEHVDDHQLEIVTALAKLGMVVPLADDVALFPGVLTAPPATLWPWPVPGLKAAVRTAVLGA